MSLTASLTVQKVALGLIMLGGILLAPVFTVQILEGNPLPFFATMGVLVSVFFLTVVGRQCWILMPAFLGLNGRLNFLPANISMLEFAILVALLLVLYEAVFEKKLPESFGPPWFWVPSILFLSIIAYHWIRSGDIGLRLLGGESFGGRKNWTMFLGFLAVPILFSMVRRDNPLLRWIPLFYFLGCVVDFIPFVLSTIAPGIAPLIFRVYSSVNLDAFQDTLYGSFGGVDIVRVGNIGFFAYACQLMLLCYFPPKLWLKPVYWWCALLSVLSLLACIFSGFRSYLFRYAIAWAVALYGSSRWIILLFIPAGCLLLAGLVFGHGSLFHLPVAMQRTLSVFPGDWDPVAMTSAEGSNSFREGIKRTYWAEYAPKAPWFGQGMTFAKEQATASMAEFYLEKAKTKIQAEEDMYRGFIERRQPHDGVVDVHLPTGWVGLGIFSWLLATCFFYIVRCIQKTPADQMGPNRLWCSAMVLTEVLSYFVVYGDLSTAMPRLCVLMPLAIRSFEAYGQLTPDSLLPFAPAADPASARNASCNREILAR